MGLENRMNVKVGALSGGQRQALALVIANMTDIKLLILDEHTAALDPKTSENIMELTDKMVKKNGITTLMVTHNLRFAASYGSRLVMMHEGKCIMDLSGEDKKNAKVEDMLEKFCENQHRDWKLKEIINAKTKKHLTQRCFFDIIFLH